MAGSQEEEGLRRLRRTSGLSLDAEGRFLHRGEPITHARTLELLHRSLRREPGGCYMVSIGRESAMVAIEAAPYAVRAVLAGAGGEHFCLRLSDGTEEPLDPSSLAVGADGVLTCTVKGDHPARFTRAGQLAMGAHIEEDPPGSECYALFVNGRRWPVRAAPGGGAGEPAEG
ncbi:MAG TPA: hypothetical protein VFG59_18385 [Anaeromyxobacter sp.]|nr:hypothetical protein [Anaeromyxobacter sp.]